MTAISDNGTIVPASGVDGNFLIFNKKDASKTKRHVMFFGTGAG